LQAQRRYRVGSESTAWSHPSSLLLGPPFEALAISLSGADQPAVGCQASYIRAARARVATELECHCYGDTGDACQLRGCPPGIAGNPLVLCGFLCGRDWRCRHKIFICRQTRQHPHRVPHMQGAAIKITSATTWIYIASTQVFQEIAGRKHNLCNILIQTLRAHPVLGFFCKVTSNES
jgi:hypothetical protein